jgi:hypothetical protein
MAPQDRHGHFPLLPRLQSRQHQSGSHEEPCEREQCDKGNDITIKP